MNNRWFGIAAIAGTVILAAIAYNIGLSEGAARAAAASGTLPAYPYWGWHRPFGFGLGFPLLFFLFWFLVVRSLFWGYPWRRRWYYYGDAVPPSFDDWHRRAHERMSSDSAPHA